MTKKVRKFIDDQTTFVYWNADDDFEVEFRISNGDKTVRFIEWGRDKKSLAKHDKTIAALIDELLAYREVLAKRGAK